MKSGTTHVVSWLRWVAFAPIAVAVHDAILYSYAPLGAFLGGYFPAWTYKLAALLFMFVATFLGVTLAIAIAPARQKAIGVLAAVGFVASDFISMRSFWSPLYTGVYLLSAITAAAAAYFLAIGVLDLIPAHQDA